jgi:hypothetical protein
MVYVCWEVSIYNRSKIITSCGDDIPDRLEDNLLIYLYDLGENISQSYGE